MAIKKVTLLIVASAMLFSTACSEQSVATEEMDLSRQEDSVSMGWDMNGSNWFRFRMIIILQHQNRGRWRGWST